MDRGEGRREGYGDALVVAALLKTAIVELAILGWISTDMADRLVRILRLKAA